MKRVVAVSLMLGLLLSVSVAYAGELIINSSQSDPAPRENMEALVAKFQEMNPDIDVKLNTTDHEGFKKAIRIWLASDSPPDIVTWFAGNRAMFFIDKGLILDITDVWENEGLFEKFPKGFQAMSFKDGRAYLLPNTYYGWAVWYRKSIFEKYNLSEPKTWDEFMQVCATLKENEITPITIGTKFRWTAAGWFDYMNMRVNGPEFHMDLMFGKKAYTDPGVKKTFEAWREPLEKGYFTENAASYSWQEAVQFMVQGKSAMYLMGQFILDSVPDDIKPDMDFFQFPIIDPNVAIGEDAPTDGYMIPKKAKNVAEAKKFLAFLASKEAQEMVVEKLGRIVTNSEVSLDLFPPLTQKGIKIIQGVDTVAQFYDRDTTPEMADKGMDAMMEWWYTPDNIDKILERLEKERKRIFKVE